MLLDWFQRIRNESPLSSLVNGVNDSVFKTHKRGPTNDICVLQERRRPLTLTHLEGTYHIFRRSFFNFDLAGMVLAKAGVPENKVDAQIPEGRPKSGRTWKVKQTSRFSFQQRQGVVGHLNKTFEEKEEIRQKKDRMLTLEREMKEENRQKAIEEKQRREDQQKRRMANEYKNSVYQTLRPEKLKGMSKKQLRMVRKTAMNKNGQLELVNPWNISERKKQGR